MKTRQMKITRVSGFGNIRKLKRLDAAASNRRDDLARIIG